MITQHDVTNCTLLTPKGDWRTLVDCTAATGLLEGLPANLMVHGDKGYDSNVINVTSNGCRFGDSHHIKTAHTISHQGI